MQSFILAEAKGMSTPGMLIMGALWLAILYFLMIRPNQVKRKKQEEMLAELQKGADVITHSGIFGTIESIKDGIVNLKIADKCIIKVHRSAISGLAAQADEQMAESTK